LLGSVLFIPDVDFRSDLKQFQWFSSLYARIRESGGFSTDAITLPTVTYLALMIDVSAAVVVLAHND
jgi:hypothetical protein